MRLIKTWVAHLADQLWNPSPTLNVVDETKIAPDLDKPSQSAIFSRYSKMGCLG
jgi:hypothetical protein